MCGVDFLSVMADCDSLPDFGQEVIVDFDLNTKYNSLKIVTM